MNKKSKIYIAGCTGLVGSTFLRKLSKEGYKNIVGNDINDLNLCRQGDVEEFFKKERPEYVFLAAAKVGGILANSTYKAEFIYDNMMIAANVINASYKYGVKKLLNLGSSCIYPKYAQQPMKEEYLLTGKLEPTNEPYAVAKIAAIKLCEYYNEQYGTNFISVMPTNLYGANDNFNLEKGHVPAAFIRKFHLSKLLSNKDYEGVKNDIKATPLGYNIDNTLNLENTVAVMDVLKGIGITGDTVTVWGTGEPYREFLYVDDLADAVIFLMQNCNYNDIGEFVNIGTGHDIKLGEFADLVKDVVGFGGKIEYDTSKPDGTPKKLLDITRIKELGWQPKVTLQDGISMSYEYYLKKTKQVQTTGGAV